MSQLLSRARAAMSEHERLHGAAVTLAISTTHTGHAVSATATKSGDWISTHTIDAPVTLRALASFKRVASEVDPERVVYLGDRNASLCLTFAKPPPAAAARSKKRRRKDHDEAVDAAVSKLSSSPPSDVVGAAKDLVRKLSDLRNRNSEEILESWALQTRDMPSPVVSQETRKQTLLLTCRFSPGTAVSLSRIMDCLSEDPDGILKCSNGAVIGERALPLSDHSAAAVDLGLATIQVAMSVGKPFEQ